MDKTLKDIAENKRIREAFIARLNPTEEEKAHPRQFVVNKIQEHIKDIVLSYEEDKAAYEARKAIKLNRQELSI